MSETLRELERVIVDRRDGHPVGSYTAELFAEPERIQRKIMEEAFEVCLELARVTVDRDRVAEEAADLMFHLLVGLASVDVTVADVELILEQRRR